MKPLADELAELELAVDELRAAIAAPLRELAVDVLLILSGWRTATVAVVLGAGVLAFLWFVFELVRSMG